MKTPPGSISKSYCRFETVVEANTGTRGTEDLGEVSGVAGDHLVLA